jgi:hypothetical protein
VIRFGSVLASIYMNLLFYLIGILHVIVATMFELSTFFLGGGGLEALRESLNVTLNIYGSERKPLLELVCSVHSVGAI